MVAKRRHGNCIMSFFDGLFLTDPRMLNALNEY